MCYPGRTVRLPGGDEEEERSRKGWESTRSPGEWEVVQCALEMMGQWEIRPEEPRTAW